MTEIDSVTLSQEPYLNFLQTALATKALQVFSLAGDASNRRYYRVVTGEKSSVLMRWDPFVDNDDYPFLSVQKHFLKHNILVPLVLAKAPELGFVLLEDLGDLTLERKFWENQAQMTSLPFYKQALDELIKIHYPASVKNNSCTAFKVEFNTEKFVWELNYGKEHLLEKFCKINLSATEQNMLADVFFSICSKLDREPKFISHRDYHSRNLMLKLGIMRVIDFQDARMGPVQYDLVSLLKDSYVNLNTEMSQHLITYYLSRRKEFISTPVNKEEFLEIYELQSIQRCFKACGSFASFHNNRNDTRYLKYLKGTLQRVKSSLLQFPEYKDFLTFLADHGLFEKEFN